MTARRVFDSLPWIDPLSKSWAIVTSAGVVRLALGLVASLVIARALGAADFGVYAVLAATVGIVGGVAEGGLTEAAVLRVAAVWPHAAATASQRAAAFFWLRVGTAALVVGIGCLVGGVGNYLLLWALIGIVATAASGAAGAILQATGAFGRMSSLTLVNAGLTAVLALALAAVAQLNVLTALIILGIGTSLAAFGLGRIMLPAGFTLQLPSWAELKTEAGHLLQTGRWLWIASLFALVTANAEVLLLNRWAALPLVGAYALALSLASKADLVNHSLYTVLLPGATGLRDRRALVSYMKRSLVRSSLISVGLLALIPLAPPFIDLLYGPQFAPTILFVQLLVGVMIFDVMATPLLLLPLAARQARLLAAGDAARAAALVVVALVLIPALGAFGAMAARLASRLVGAAVVGGGLWLHRAAFDIQYEEASASAHERPAT